MVDNGCIGVGMQPGAGSEHFKRHGALLQVEQPVRKTGRGYEFTEFVSARMPAFRRLAFLLCQDWHLADDLVQAAITRLYVHWHRVGVMDNPEAYFRTILVRESLNQRRSSWARKVSLTGELPDWPQHGPDHDDAIDVGSAMADLPPRQRATLVLRFYCDLSVDQVAEVLGCSSGTVKSQTSRALDSLRTALLPAESIRAPGANTSADGRRHREVHNHG
jgi:RNA polymerase sigma-70 factor (sigma-E family)